MFARCYFATLLLWAFSYASADSAKDYDRAFAKAYNYLCRPDRARDKAIGLFKDAIKLDPNNSRNLEAEYYIARMWGGDCQPDERVDTKKYVGCMESIFKQYESRKNTYWYIKLRITYAQLLAGKDSGKAKRILWSIIRLSPDEIDVPEKGRFWRTSDRAIEKIKTAAVWALLHEETRKLRTGPKGKQNKRVLGRATEVRQEIAKDEKARRWLPYADWWIRVTKAPRLKNVSQPAPYRSSSPARRHEEPLVEKAVDYLRRQGRLKDMFSKQALPTSRPQHQVNRYITIPDAAWVEKAVVERKRENPRVWIPWLCLSGGLIVTGALIIVAGYYVGRKKNRQ